MAKKQTAVEYYANEYNKLLIKQLSNEIDAKQFDYRARALVEISKDMEKEQMLEMWNGGINCTEEGGKSFDHYYNETYKQP